MIKQHSHRKGFTLIEVIIYLALFAILMTGSLVAAFSIIESGGDTTARASLAEEGSFIIAKMRYTLEGATAISSPGAGGQAKTLGATVVSGFDSNGTPLVQTVSLDPSTLVGGMVSISGVNFYHALASGNGINPESVGVSFTLSTRTQKGSLVSEDFFSTTSLKK